MPTKTAPNAGPPLTGDGRAAVHAVNDLQTYYRNPRVGNVDQIAESLRVNAQYRPIVVNLGTQTGRPLEVLAGNHTLLAARHLGWPTIQTWQLDVDDVTASRIVAADNRTADLGTYDEEALLALLSDVAADPEGLAGTGYTEEELGKMLADAAPRPGSAEEFLDTPNLEVESQYGVIVMCTDEADQQAVYNELHAGPRPVRVVTI